MLANLDDKSLPRGANSCHQESTIIEKEDKNEKKDIIDSPEIIPLNSPKSLCNKGTVLYTSYLELWLVRMNMLSSLRIVATALSDTEIMSLLCLP